MSRLVAVSIACVFAAAGLARAAPQAAAPPDPALFAAERAVARPPAPPAATDTVPKSLRPNEPATVEAPARNRGATLTVHSLVLRDSYGGRSPRAGAKLAVIDTEWENIIPLTLVYERQVPTAYKVPDLADNLYLLVNGRRLATLPHDAEAIPGHLPVKDFTLERIGSTERGNVVFEVPAEGLSSMELRFYDYAHGHMVIPLLQTADAKPAADDKPLSPPQKNEVLEVAAYDLKKAGDLAGRAAPPGMTFVTVDLRARSLFTVDADADAFDPKARKGAKTKIGHVADWKESRKYLQLVADGEYAYMPEPQTELGEEPRFLPDVMTGGTVTFLAPADAKSLELRCDFPNAKASTGGAVFRPKGLTVALEGKRPALPNRPAVASVDDDVYRVSVIGEQAAAEFAGQAAPAGNKFLVLDVTVANNGRNGEFFQTKQQLKHADETGGQQELSPVTFEGPRRPPELIWVPPGERRSFQAVFPIRQDESRPRLAFTGVSKAQVLNLQPLGATAVAAATTPAAAGAAKPPAMQPAPAKEPVKVAANSNPAAPAPSPAAPSTPTVPKAVPPTNEPLKQAADAKPLRVAAKQPFEPKGLAGVGLTAEQVNAAIDRGAVALWAHQVAEMKTRNNEFGRNLGYDLLVALALVHADYHKKSPEFDAQLRGMLSRINPSDVGTYGAGILAMLVERYGDGYYLPKLRQTVRCVLENQYPNGTWGYEVSLDAKLLRDPGADRVLQVRGGIPLEGVGSTGEEMKREKPFDLKNPRSGDNSTTQYALLGLWSAAKAKTRVAPEVWQASLKSYRDRQCDDGGWSYNDKSSYGYGSMTCAGVSSIALARHFLGEQSPAEDAAVERGLAWLANNFSVSKHVNGSDAHLYYYLYSLERVGRILDTEFIGNNEWYPLGAKFLLGRQLADGNWKGSGEEERPELATSFALLFLTRATTTLNIAEKHGGNGKLRTDVAAAPGNRVYIILDCSGSMLEEIDGKQKFEIARDAVTGLLGSMPDTAEVALRAYGHRKNARQEGADEDTELLLRMGRIDRKAAASKLATLRARGKTPLALSLKQAAQDVAGVAGDKDKPVTVVLLTDGGEDTRGRPDPVAAAAALAKLPGINLQVVGFDINRPDWTEQLQGIARSGGGQYLTAAHADALLRQLKSAVFRVPETFVVATAKGQPIMQAPFGAEKALPEGQYQLTTTFGGRRYSQSFWINTDATTAVVFDAAKIAGDKSGHAVAETDVADAPAADTPAAAAPAPAAARRKFCTNCGAPLAPNAKFCTKCGAKVAG